MVDFFITLFDDILIMKKLHFPFSHLIFTLDVLALFIRSFGNFIIKKFYFSVMSFKYFTFILLRKNIIEKLY